MEKVTIQHGDVLLKKVEVIPVDAKKVDLTGVHSFIIEKGEGVNTHELVSSELGALCDLVDIFDKDGILFVKVKEGKQVKLTHQEHQTQVLEPGIHRKEIEQVFDYEKMEAARTRD